MAWYIDVGDNCYHEVKAWRWRKNGIIAFDKEVISRSASYKKLKFLETRKSLLIERRMQGVGIV